MEQMNWTDLLPTATSSYNNSYNHSLKMTPSNASLDGYDPELRIDVADDVLTVEIPSARTGAAAA